MHRRTSIIFTIFISIVLLMESAVMSEDSASELAQKASAAGRRGDNQSAIKLATQAIAKDQNLAVSYYLRGRAHFCVGNVRESVADFDKYVELNPKAAPSQWERGISYYYDGQFEKGAKQFELYQSYDDADVENSVWRYLCMARAESVKKAREAMLPIENDRRVPMMQIYEMFRGKLQPDDVMKVATAGELDKVALNRQLFYAHLYIGLFYEADGNSKLAKKHLTLAADEHKIGHYMWDVANVHAKMLRKMKK